MLVSTVLLLYHHPMRANAPTIMEHVSAFDKYSNFQVVPVNIAHGFPKFLREAFVEAIIIHYSAYFWSWGDHSIGQRYPYSFDERFFRYIVSQKQAVKVMFFQDEMANIPERLRLIENFEPDFIYSLLDHERHDEVYKCISRSIAVGKTLTGYVCDQLIEKSFIFSKPFESRSVDVGYRARKLGYHFGRGAREKSEIAERFLEAVQSSILNADISVREEDRIYGDDWYRFVANCKFMLGVMAGTSIFDFTGEVKRKTDEYLSQYPDASFAQVQEAVLLPYEGNLDYRTISPRLFECAALRVCMILYRDDYQGILKAGVHYIPLEKDFSNIDVVLRQMRDRPLVDRIVENAYQNLIASGQWHYREFIQEFDQVLKDLGCLPAITLEDQKSVESLINKDARRRYFTSWLKSLRSRSFPGRKHVKDMAYILGFKGARR